MRRKEFLCQQIKTLYNLQNISTHMKNHAKQKLLYAKVVRQA